MTERPILMSAPMVRAILSNTKTQTRRPLRVQPPDNTVHVMPWHHPDPRPMFYAWVRNGEPVPDHLTAGAEISEWPPAPCPYGQPGDRLWVRETHMDLGACFLYRADHGAETERALVAPGQRWRPAIHMPRAASRITLEVTEVRVERLQAISRGDALAEGIVETCGGYGLPAGEHFHAADPRQSYFSLWETINGPGSVEANPWLWCVEFRRVEVCHG